MTEDEHTREAEKELARYMEARRQERVVNNILSAAFRDGEVQDDVNAEVESDIESAKEAAKRYAQARNCNARIRTYGEHNESAREGVASALSWLQRKKKSAIR